MSSNDDWVRVDRGLLRAWPLPTIAQDADKEDRGKILVVGGSCELAGAALLAGVAALRAGAGKLAIATASSVASHMAVAVPEARVIGLPETAQGALGAGGVERLASQARAIDAALIGPGMADAAGTRAFVAGLLGLLVDVPVVLDALAMDAVFDVQRFAQPVLLTPHAGELAHLLGIDKQKVLAHPAESAAQGCDRWHAVVALKGSATWIASPGGGRWRHDAGHPGLGTSGSGDVLSGIISGLAARGAPLEQACVWGVALHAMAGGALERERGPLGYLARELAAQVPPLLNRLGGARLSPRAHPPTAG